MTKRTDTATKFLTMMAVALCMVIAANAQQLVIPLSETDKDNFTLAIDSVQLSAHPDQTMSLALQFCLTGKKLPKGQRVVIEPVMQDSTHTVSFKSVEIYGNYAYYDFVRNRQSVLDDTTALQFRHNEVRNYLPYHQTIASEPWMSRAELTLHVTRTDGCGNELSCQTQSVVAPTPTYHFKESGKLREVQVEQLHGTAYVAFPVNRTELLPDFRDNQRELSQLKHTIDSVCQAPNIEIRSITIKGYASPEGSYANNERLARERTNSLSLYIAEQSHIAPELMHTAYEPEDWQGLRRHVEYMQLPDREAILTLIDSDMEPDAKLAKIAAEHPATYKQLLDQVFPLLRHTDYQIDYTQKSVTEHQGTVTVDTIYSLPLDTLPTAPNSVDYRFRPYRPLLALKTNLLMDLALAPNIAIEVPLGRKGRWSIMAEYMNPWYRWDRLDYSYQIQAGLLELRCWIAPNCSRPYLTGHYVGVFGGAGKYDLELKGEGNQGEVYGGGFSYGYSWPISRHWNLELGISVGALFDTHRHYMAEFQSTHLIYKRTENWHFLYAGPTNLKLSLVYIIGKKMKQK